MAYSRTLSELETAVRREADMVNSTFVTSDEVRAYINQSWAELYDRIVLFDQEYLLRYVEIPSSGAGVYDILNAGKTGIVVTITLTAGGTGYSVGEVVELSSVNTPSTLATATVASINAMTGQILSITLTSAGAGYWLSSLTSNTLTLNCVSGSSGINGQVSAYIDSDFYKCKGVWISGGGSGSTSFWNPLRRFQWDEQNLLNQANLYQGSQSLPLYRLYTLSNREKLAIAPDSVGGTFKVWYYPAPQKMLSDTSRIDGRSGWDEWVVKDAAIKCLLKEESIEQAASIKVIRDELFQRFQLHASERDASQPERIRDCRLLSRRYGYWR
jgi:hypothetical protein